ncbi:MAG: hypothetical protein IJT70_07265 [Clostridia bacterium]|nr:hypothetical protein [Clostridia bacterium]
MRKFSKTLLALLLVAMMLAGAFPFGGLVTTASAAGQGGTYKYVLVTNPSIGKQYLIASSNSAGSANIVKIASGTTEGGATTHDTQTVVTSGGQTYINAWDGDQYSEFTMVPGVPQGNDTTNAPATYMFYNTGTGMWLYNNYYENGNTTGTVTATADPLTDGYQKGSRVIFASNSSAYQSAWGLAANNMTVTNSTSWVQFDTQNNSDPQAVVKFGNGITAADYPCLNIVYHPNKMQANSVSRMFFHGTGYSYDGTKNVSFTGGTANWILVTGTLNAANDGFTWVNGSQYWTGSSGIGTAYQTRFDVWDSGGYTTGAGAWVDSFVFYKNIYARLCSGQFMMTRAWHGNSGFYPSHRFLGCQFGNYTSSTITSGQYLINHGTSAYQGKSWEYQYGFNTSGNLERSWEKVRSNINGRPVYFYEKQYTDESCTWNLVTGALASGDEVILCNAGESASNSAYILTSSASTAGSKSVTASAYTSSVSATHVWRVIMVGDYFLLQNKSTGQILFDNKNSTATAFSVQPVPCEGGTITHGYKYRFTYNASTHKLTANSNNFNDGETIASQDKGIQSGTTVYLYKRSFHTHTWGTGVVTTPANCVDTGVMTYTCSSCGATKTETIPVNSSNHKSPTDVAAVAATCVSQGTAAGRRCTACGVTISGLTPTAINPNNHAGPINNTAAVAATCSATGYTAGKQCAACQAYTEGHTTTPIDSNAHNWNAGVVTTQPTCTTAGVKTYTCTIDSSHTRTEAVSALGHNMTAHPAVAATCTTAGNSAYWYCSRCQKYFSDAAGNNEIAANSWVIGALGHSWGAWTTGNDTHHTRTCTRSGCGATDSEAHNWEAQPGGTTATCVTPGSGTQECTVCHRTKTVTGNVDPTNHTNLTHTAAVAATCTTAGNIEYYYCSGCNKYFAADGTTQIQQSSIAIAALGHNYQLSQTIAPTCTTGGYDLYVCANDASHTEQRNPTAALGHDMGPWYEVTAPTRVSDGLKRRDCQRTGCTYYETEVIPMLTDPTMTVESVSTTRGSTVSIDVDLSSNPGIWAQNFVIYYPKALTLNSVTASGDVYPVAQGQASALNMDPVSNARMSDYFDDAGVSKTGYYGMAYYVDNGAIENATADGTIITLSFTVPATGSETTYPVGIFGVFAPTDDAIDEDGNSLSDQVVYVNGTITITNPQVDCGEGNHTWGEWIVTTPAGCTTPGERHHICSTCGRDDYETIPAGNHNYVDTIVAPTCTTAGYTTHTCSICGNTYTDTPVAALGHNLGEWVVVREPTGLSRGLRRKTCSRCDYYEEEEFGTATGTGISNTGDTQTYRYELTDTILPGHEYVIANSNAAGSAKALYDNSGATASGAVTVANDNGTKYIATATDTYVWNSLSGTYLENKSTGNFLKAFSNTTNADNTSLNLALSADPANTNDYKFNSGKTSGYHTSAGSFKLGYEASITGQSAGSGTYAEPHSTVTKVKAYNHLTGYNGSTITSSSTFSLSFDFAFEKNNGIVIDMRREGYQLVTINGTAKQVSIVGLTDNAVSFNYTDEELWSYRSWNHFDIKVQNGTATYHFNDITGSFTVTKGTDSKEGIMVFESSGFANGNYVIDNFVFWNGSNYYTIENGDFSGFTGSTDGLEAVSRASGYAVNNAPTTTTLASDVFVAASSNPTTKVYFYEKRMVGDAVEVYKRASAVTSGKSYVLVNRNLEGSGSLLAGAGTTSSIAVDSDGISYTPYVMTAASNEFVASAKGAGYIFNNTASSKFLSATSAESALSSGCYLTVTNAATGAYVTAAGATYYLYEKTPIEVIDSDLIDDFAVIDFGSGFAGVPIRANDHYTDRVGMTVTGIMQALPSGRTPNNVFYATDTATYATPITLTSGTVSFANGTISYVPNGARLESVDTFYYGASVNKLGAYMYAKATIIPATSIYYEDTSSFITYTDGNYPTAATGAKWQTVSSNDPVNYLFEDVVNAEQPDATYGYNSENEGNYYYSAGTVKWVRILSSNEDKSWSNEDWMPSLTFQFKGTGFEFFSAVGKSSGNVFVSVTRDNNGTAVDVDYTMINNYFGYTWNGSAWTANSGAADTALYQLPVYRQDFGTYGTYTVKIQVQYNDYFDVAHLGYADFYFDGFRVFNPLGATTSAPAAAVAQYKADSEYDPKFINIRDSLVTDASATGALFVDGNGLTRQTSAVADYDTIGAKNEAMLKNGNGVTFRLTSNAAAQPDKVALGAKVACGTAGEITVLSNNVVMDTISVASGTDMYFDITEYVEWEGSAGNWTSKAITFTNTSSVSGTIVSLTTLKITSAGLSATPTLGFAAANVEEEAWEALAEVYGFDYEPGDIDGDGVVTAKDVRLLKQYLAGLVELSKYDEEVADIDGNGDVTSRDSRALKALLTA